MIPRPKLSRNEWKTNRERSALKLANVAPFSCPVLGLVRLARLDLLLGDLVLGHAHGIPVDREVVLRPLQVLAAPHRRPVEHEDRPRELVLPLGLGESRVPRLGHVEGPPQPPGPRPTGRLLLNVLPLPAGLLRLDDRHALTQRTALRPALPPRLPGGTADGRQLRRVAARPHGPRQHRPRLPQVLEVRRAPGQARRHRRDGGPRRGLANNAAATINLSVKMLL